MKAAGSIAALGELLGWMRSAAPAGIVLTLSKESGPRAQKCICDIAQYNGASAAPASCSWSSKQPR